jgi:excisionase family DNA binding protein
MNQSIQIPAKNQSNMGAYHIKTASDNVVSATSSRSTHKSYDIVFRGYPDILDVKQVGELLGVSTKTVYRLLNEGTLDSLKVGRAFKIPKLYLLQYIKVMGHAQQQG